MSLKFSIIIPLYNKESSVVKTLDSVLLQSYKDYEIVLVNDGSTDSSLSVVENYFSNNKDIDSQIITTENKGVSEARNIGVEHAKNDFVAFLDADDIWEPNHLETLVRLINEYPLAVLWSTDVGYMYGNQKVDLPNRFNEVNGYIDDFFVSKRGKNIFCVCTSVFRKSVFQEMGGYDARIRIGEDLDLAWRVISTHKVAHAFVTTMYYVQDAENRAMHRKHNLENRLSYYIEKYDSYRINEDFSRYLDNYCVNECTECLLQGEDYKMIKRILSRVSFRNVKPYSLFRLIMAKLKYKLCLIPVTKA